MIDQTDAPGDQSVRRFRERLALLYMLRNSLIALAVWGTLYGVAVLAARSIFQAEPLPLLWGLASLPVALAVAGYFAWRALPSASAVRALVDSHGRCGGLVVAAAEAPLGKWSSTGREPDAPLPRWNASPYMALCAVGPVLLLVAFLVPASFVQAGGRLDISRDVDRMKEQTAALEQEKALDPKRAEAMKAELEDIRRDASGRDPARTLEALDNMQAKLDNAAQQEAEAAPKHMELLDHAQTLADALARGSDRLEPDQLADAMAHLDKLMKKAADENKLVAAHLGPELLEALKKAKKLTPEQAKKLAQALKDGKAATLSKMARLLKARLISAEQMGKCEKCGEGNVAALAVYLKENGLGEAGDRLLDLKFLLPGDGDGGPGARLMFGDESSDLGAKFKEQELPPGALEKLAGTDLEGVSGATPKVNKGGASGPGGALSGSKAGGGSSGEQAILPRHRAAVKRYFERAPMKKPN